MAADAGASFDDAEPYILTGADGKPYRSATPGTLGGYRPRKIYGRLDCPSAARAIARGGYVRHRVFFADEPTAIAAGYRPCARCMPAEYRAWRAQHAEAPAPTNAEPGDGTPIDLRRPDVIS